MRGLQGIVRISLEGSMLNPWKDGPQHVGILELCAIMYGPQKVDCKNRAHLSEDSMHPMDMEEGTYAGSPASKEACRLEGCS